MSVPSYERTESKLVVLIKARELATYTIQICSNPKWFPPDYRTALTDDITRTAKDIYIDCWTANNIRVSGKLAREKFLEREGLQRKAILNCNNLLAMIELALKVYHLRAGRIEYWTRLTLETRKLITAWHQQTVDSHRDLL